MSWWSALTQDKFKRNITKCLIQCVTLRVILEKLGCSSKFLSMHIQFYEVQKEFLQILPNQKHHQAKLCTGSFTMVLNQTQRKWMIKTIYIHTCKNGKPIQPKAFTESHENFGTACQSYHGFGHSHKSFRSFECDRMAMWQAQKSLSNTLIPRALVWQRSGAHCRDIKTLWKLSQCPTD